MIYRVTIQASVRTVKTDFGNREHAVDSYCFACKQFNIEPVFGLIDCSATNGEVTVTLKQIESK